MIDGKERMGRVTGDNKWDTTRSVSGIEARLNNISFSTGEPQSELYRVV